MTYRRKSKGMTPQGKNKEKVAPIIRPLVKTCRKKNSRKKTSFSQSSKIKEEANPRMTPRSPTLLHKFVEEVFRDVMKEGCHITRFKKLVTGVALHNPFNYDNCIICPKGFYKEQELRSHYTKSHSLDFGDAPLPETKIALDNHQTSCQLSSRCMLCGLVFSTEVGLLEHKTRHHVDPRFMRYKCSKCAKKFVLQGQLAKHISSC